ncbi:4-hydroxy-tetrahydrodipicolinate reductase [Fulvivirgaceae bacterium BMA10]|uniref:4-hydroxy-tetrahydrodipicolinate reductase n=1 Tax=Splendidivirga corallicola TaxID=3051826 RepID=A0ABT8KST6_9BACT|nr:4-hydroxy-tetrahydrodipicolinate reductase [Fulvivirgaceae bacterium BMA10]
MKVLILGYGKMGRAIEKIALDRGHTVPYKIDQYNAADLLQLGGNDVDVAIEFSQPDSAFENIKTCLQNGIPVVSGTTGWLEKKNEIDALCAEKDGAFFYASNYSIGVNIFFKLNKYLAKIMDHYAAYDVGMEEIHHIHKKDEPSGTAITLAEGIASEMKRKDHWALGPGGTETQISITSKREGEVPGTHVINYASEIDDIEIKHTAHSRTGFALGAVLVAEWLKDKKGSLGMDDFLDIPNT